MLRHQMFVFPNDKRPAESPHTPFSQFLFAFEISHRHVWSLKAQAAVSSPHSDLRRAKPLVDRRSPMRRCAYLHFFDSGASFLIYNSSEMRLLASVLLTVSTASSSPLQNANHIFNAIHSSMRQWGSSWNHNGMSFFLATVPQHTVLYHGSHSIEPTAGPDWLAFEPEHALWFTNIWMKRPSDSTHAAATKGHLGHSNQFILKSEEEVPRGWLHTYEAAKDLRLLYVDGISAGKSVMGTLDSQDRILFNDRINDSHADLERANMACRIFQNDWGGRIDGLLRMETGFEVILCDFDRNMHRINVIRGKPHPQNETFGKPAGSEMWRLYKVIAERFGGIGGGRVRLNYEHFVTAYNYPDLDLFKESAELPRLKDLSLELLEPIKRDLYRLVMEDDPSQTSYNWQDITDIIITRYANDLKYFVSGKLDTTNALQLEVERILLPFIDFDNREFNAEVSRCAAQFLTASQPVGTLASAAVKSISTSICTTLRSALELKEYNSIVSSIQELIDYLAWTAWKECTHKCQSDETCFIPIWPAGTVEDRKNPQCKDRANNSSGPPYWDKRPLVEGTNSP